MLAYVRLVQAREKELGCDVLTHQKWSGAGYIDGILGHIQSGSSGSKSMGDGNTETGRLCVRWGVGKRLTLCRFLSVTNAGGFGGCVENVVEFSHRLHNAIDVIVVHQESHHTSHARTIMSLISLNMSRQMGEDT